jgi:hypothetical protein
MPKGHNNKIHEMIRVKLQMQRSIIQTFLDRDQPELALTLADEALAQAKEMHKLYGKEVVSHD